MEECKLKESGRPKKPVKPREPQEPHKPPQYIDKHNHIEVYEGAYSLQDILDLAPKGTKLENIFVSNYESHYDWDYSYSHFECYYITKESNNKYKEQLIKYKQKLKEYKLKKEQYKSKYKQYLIQKKAYDKYVKKEKAKSLEKQISQLKKRLENELEPTSDICPECGAADINPYHCWDCGWEYDS